MTPRSVVAYEVYLAAPALEKAVTTVENAPPLNLKKAPLIVLEEEVRLFSFCLFI